MGQDGLEGQRLCSAVDSATEACPGPVQSASHPQAEPGSLLRALPGKQVR